MESFSSEIQSARLDYCDHLDFKKGSGVIQTGDDDARTGRIRRIKKLFANFDENFPVIRMRAVRVDLDHVPHSRPGGFQSIFDVLMAPPRLDVRIPLADNRRKSVG